MPDLIQLEDVTAWRGDSRVFEGLSLEIPLGCNTVILGPNGAGKTTLLKLLSREIHPEHRDGSSLRLFGRERWNVWELRARIGIVSHDLQTTYPGHFTGRDVVVSGYYSSLGVWAHQRITDAQRRRAGEVLERLGVGALADRPYREVSTGEQRRFLLARALVHDPQALVLDEPTSGLDLQACFQYLDTVRGLMRAGKTVILVTHHVHEIPPEIERAVLLRDGRVVADGAKAEMLTSERLSRLFDVPMEVLQVNGFYQAVPADREGGGEG